MSNKPPKLPSDCIEEILKILNDNGEKGSLHSWTLVNRSLGQVAISLLWSNPFDQILLENHSRSHLLIQTYLSCLDKEKRQILLDEGLDIPLKSSLFDYPIFLKKLRIEVLQLSLVQWWTNNTTYRIRNKANFYILDAILSELLINKCNGLKLLSFDTQINYGIADFASFSGIQNTICSLKEFRINCGCPDHSGYLANLLSLIIENSQRITHLVITPHDDGAITCQIPKLIESQINLEKFSMIYSFAGSFNPNRSASIYSALTSQKDSLTHADFRKIYIEPNSLEILAKCNKLRSLYFVNCQQEQDITLCDSLIQLPITKLVLNNSLGKNSLTNTTCTSIIMMAASTLVELTIDYLTPEVVEVINTQIPNLNSLAIRTTTLPLLNFISQSTVEHLALSDFGTESNLFSITFLQQLGRLLPITLKHLQIECRYNVAPESLTALLEECKAPLNIISLDVEIFDDTLLEVIADYARETGKRLKELRIGKDTTIEYDEKLCKKLTTVISSINQDYVDPWPLLIERRDPLWKDLDS
ncbi:6770_t:CDS:2 [Diversispora eburnea]|uniref:6770_t:CDS:1 n=1 Tax=Diversispora eburnea TaxID=1213867 RepID=A0A9N9BRT6_9GLOM|nr:6770_t:CDS:2 [Diversispora eburnea]